ncbi:MAG: hypothetical protein ACOC78_02755 [Actinomycetota bacterium]
MRHPFKKAVLEFTTEGKVMVSFIVNYSTGKMMKKDLSLGEG